MFDKRRAAAEAANHTTIGFFNGLGFLAAVLAVPFLLAHFLVIVVPVAVCIVVGRLVIGAWPWSWKSVRVDRAEGDQPSPLPTTRAERLADRLLHPSFRSIWRK